MTHTSKAVYLGSIDGVNHGLTPGDKYDVCDHGDGFIDLYDDNDIHRCIKNGAFHKFWLIEDDENFVTETEYSVSLTINDEKPKLRYYINGHEVDMVEFGNVRYQVLELDEDGVKCDTIKFEVKFQ